MPLDSSIGKNSKIEFVSLGDFDRVMASHQTLAFSTTTTTCTSVENMLRDLRDLGQVVDALQKNFQVYPDLEHEVDHLHEGNQQIIARENGLIEELQDLRVEMKELHTQQEEIMWWENIMEDIIRDLKV